MEPQEHLKDSAPTDEAPRWLDRPGNVGKLIKLTIVLCAASVLADLFYEKHGHYGFESITGFHAMYGFICYVGLVLISAQLRKVLMREEDYYD